MDSPSVPGEILVDIFLCLPNLADLVRTSAACVSFCRLVADRSFLRQYRKIHAAPLLGFIDCDQNFHPAVQPHPSAPAARAVALAADFSFSFLPARKWVLLDIRDGRVLLERIYYQYLNSIAASREIVVCDPLHRRYVVLPPIPEDVLQRRCNTFLVPSAGSGDKEEAAEETAFRVIWMARRGDKLVALVFSSSTGQWEAGASHSWRDSFSRLLNLPGSPNYSAPQYAYGCLYWVTDCREKLLMLDIRRMEFSIADAPPEAKLSVHAAIAMVEAGEGRPGMFVLPLDKPHLSYTIWRNKGRSSGQWHLERTISLGFVYRFVCSTERQLFLQTGRNYFSLDVKTFQPMTVCASMNKYVMLWPRPYSNFPPSLSSPTVASGFEIGTEKETLEQGCAANSSAQPPWSG